MASRFFDRETDPAVLVGVHYNCEDNRYYIAEDAYFRHRNRYVFSCTKAYKKGILNAPCDYSTMAAALRNARLYAELHFAYKFVGFVPDYRLYGYNGRFIDTGKPFCVGVRRYQGETYRFYVGMAGKYTFARCNTPSNCFGYDDVLLLNGNNDIYQLERNDVPAWIRNKVTPILQEIEKAGCEL